MLLNIVLKTWHSDLIMDKIILDKKHKSMSSIYCSEPFTETLVSHKGGRNRESNIFKYTKRISPL